MIILVEDLNHYFYFYLSTFTLYLNLIIIASCSRSSGATSAHANGYLWALLINMDEAHMRRKNLLQRPCLYLPS